ncbi:unnamed protein product [Adineta ricciae]|uniref:non-specific serine/threonine protein kinase n=1 Tax=Adineta ricciae TaxID=249248 RepID=A0A813PR75_ADIRI|nr:unnamed protein product [Adineta ricciae]
MEKYTIDENLGLDTLAERIIVHRKDSDESYILSKMELMDMTTAAVAYQEYLPLMKLSTEKVAAYADIFTSVEHKISATYINLVSEYFPMGNLDKYLRKLRQDKIPLNNQLIDKWSAQILDGLMYLWNQKIIHRNLKPDSIYLRGESHAENCSLVVGDMIPPSVAYDVRMRTRLPRRALSYTAPEIFQSGEYTIQSDIYSYGHVLLDMITCDMLNDEETLQLCICARHDSNTLSQTLQTLRKTHKVIAALIENMMHPNRQKRLTEVDLRRDDYVIESMHNIDSDQVKYPAERDKKWARDGLAKNEKLEYYINYLKQHRNAESRIEHALKLCNQSKSIDLSALANSFQGDILPVVEHFLSNSIIVEETLELLKKIIHNETIITAEVVALTAKFILIFENDEHLTEKIADVLIKLATHNAKLVNNARLNSNLVQVMTKHTNHGDISAKCCTLIWLMAKDSISKDLRDNQISLLSTLLNILQKHPNNVDLFTKVCFAFLPFIFEKSTIEHLVQFNLVRCFSIGLRKHYSNRNAVKAGLAVLSELFKLDERCVMRFLCSRTDDGELLDSMQTLNKIFDQFKNHTDIARGIITLLKSMSPYDDAIDEMISTKIDANLLYQIKRFHSDNDDIARACEDIMIRIRQRQLHS